MNLLCEHKSNSLHNFSKKTTDILTNWMPVRFSKRKTHQRHSSISPTLRYLGKDKGKPIV